MIGDGSDEFDCEHCGLHVNADEPDPCFGRLPGVLNACCGHGKPHPMPYIQFENGVSVYFKGTIFATAPRCESVDDDGVHVIHGFEE